MHSHPVPRQLDDHRLRQLDEAYLGSLEPDALLNLASRLLADLKEARERLSQTPRNHLRPPSTRAPRERGAVARPMDEPE